MENQDDVVGFRLRGENNSLVVKDDVIKGQAFKQIGWRGKERGLKTIKEVLKRHCNNVSVNDFANGC